MEYNHNSNIYSGNLLSPLKTHNVIIFLTFKLVIKYSIREIYAVRSIIR